MIPRRPLWPDLQLRVSELVRSRSRREPVVRELALLVVVTVALVGCVAGPDLSHLPTASTAPASSFAVDASASNTTAQTTTGLKLALIDKFGPLWYCDPDIYPIARDTETDRALARWPEVTSDRATTEA